MNNAHGIDESAADEPEFKRAKLSDEDKEEFNPQEKKRPTGPSPWTPLSVNVSVSVGA